MEVRAQSGREEKKEEEREPDRRSSLRGLTDTGVKRRRRRSIGGKLMDLILERVFLEGGAQT